MTILSAGEGCKPYWFLGWQCQAAAAATEARGTPPRTNRQATNTALLLLALMLYILMWSCETRSRRWTTLTRWLEERWDEFVDCSIDLISTVLRRSVARRTNFALYKCWYALWCLWTLSNYYAAWSIIKMHHTSFWFFTTHADIWISTLRSLKMVYIVTQEKFIYIIGVMTEEKINFIYQWQRDEKNQERKKSSNRTKLFFRVFLLLLAFLYNSF